MTVVCLVNNAGYRCTPGGVSVRVAHPTVVVGWDSGALCAPWHQEFKFYCHPPIKLPVNAVMNSEAR